MKRLPRFPCTTMWTPKCKAVGTNCVPQCPTTRGRNHPCPSPPIGFPIFTDSASAAHATTPWVDPVASSRVHTSCPCAHMPQAVQKLRRPLPCLLGCCACATTAASSPALPGPDARRPVTWQAWTPSHAIWTATRPTTRRAAPHSPHWWRRPWLRSGGQLFGVWGIPPDVEQGVR